MTPLNDKTRAWAYRVMLALVTLAAVYGLIGNESVAAWTALVTAVLGNGLASLHTDNPLK